MKVSTHLLAGFLTSSVLAGSLVAGGSTYIVTELDDGAPGSLRAELATASDGDTISFAVRGTIFLTNGELLVSNNVTFAGPGATNLAISGAGQSRVMEVLPHVHIGLFGLTICDGHAADGIAGTSNNPAGGNGSNGGGIYNAGFVTIAQCVISNCAAGNGGAGYSSVPFVTPEATNWTGGVGGCGGAIFNLGRLSLDGCTLTSNSCGIGGNGGGADQYGAAGRPGGSGGAIYNAGTMTLRHCAFAHNSAGLGGDGGASYSGKAGSAAPGGSGGAVYAAGTVRLNDCTFTGNLAGSGGRGGSNPFPASYPFGPGDGGTGGSGGALCCLSNLAATNCLFLANQAGTAGVPGLEGFDLNMSGQGSSSGADGGQGGGIAAYGPLVLYACSISGNFGGDGGPADPSSGAVANAETSSANAGAASPRPNFIYYERQGGPGGSGGTGGIYSENNLLMILCTLEGNRGGAGGPGGQSWGSFMYEDGPTGGNGGSGGPGGAYCTVSNELALVACTVADNTGGLGGVGGSGPPRYDGDSGNGSGGQGGVGGIELGSPAPPASAINTLVASNLGGVGGTGAPSGGPGAPDLHGSFSSLGHNLIAQAQGSSGFANGVNGDLVGSAEAPLNPILGPLADNGGPTLTMALLHGSPCLDAGDDSLLGAPYALMQDQRGFPRKSGPHVDIGAFEFQYTANKIHPQRHAPNLSGTFLSNGNLQPNTVSEGSTAPSYQLTFRNERPGATFSVLATSDLSVPSNQWLVIGQAVQTSPGLFQFTDLQATNTAQRFYRVSSP